MNFVFSWNQHIFTVSGARSPGWTATLSDTS